MEWPNNEIGGSLPKHVNDTFHNRDEVPLGRGVDLSVIGVIGVVGYVLHEKISFFKYFRPILEITIYCMYANEF